MVGGNGLYLHKLGHCIKIDPVRGNGLYLTSHKSLSGVNGDGFGLILGPNGPFKNIPILNLLL